MMKTTKVEFAQSAMKTTYWSATKNVNARKKLFAVSARMDSEKSLKNVMLERMKILDALIVRFKEVTFVKKLNKAKIIVFRIAETVF